MNKATPTPTDSLIGAHIERLGHLRHNNKITHEQAVDQLVTYAGGALTRHGAELQLTRHTTAAARWRTVENDRDLRITGTRNARDFTRADLRGLGRAA